MGKQVAAAAGNRVVAAAAGKRAVEAGKRRCPVVVEAGSRLAAAAEVGKLHPVAEVGKAPSCWVFQICSGEVNTHTQHG